MVPRRARAARSRRGHRSHRRSRAGSCVGLLFAPDSLTSSSKELSPTASGRSSSSAPGSMHVPTDSRCRVISRSSRSTIAEVLALKQRLLDELELMSECRRRVVVADLVTDDWLQLLADTGWTSAQPTVWVAEGLLVYLNHDSRTHLLTQLSSASDMWQCSWCDSQYADRQPRASAVASGGHRRPGAVVGAVRLAGDRADDGGGERRVRTAHPTAL